MKYIVKATHYKLFLICFCMSLSNYAMSSPSPVATFSFNNNLAPHETNIPNLSPIDPLGENKFVSDNVFGETRQVYEFNGNTLSAENAGLVFPSNNILNNDDAFSIEMIFQFKENQSTWENIFGLSNRQSDQAFYVNPDDALQVWPDNSGAESFVYGAYHHVTLTNDGNGHVVVYIDGLFQFDSTTEIVNFSTYTDVNPERLIHFFADNVVGGGQNEFSDGRVALIRIYDVELNAEDASNISKNPFSTSSSCPITNNACVATYNADGTLSIPCVTVPNAEGGTTMYQAEMKLIPLSNPYKFELITAEDK